MKEKAMILVGKFYPILGKHRDGTIMYESYSEIGFSKAKQYAILCVDEMIKLLPMYITETFEELVELKKEIELL